MIRVLVVDDEREVEHLFKLQFRKEIKAERIEFAFKFSGSEALGYLRSLGKDLPHIVLLDINMPGMSGLEVLQNIKKINRELIVIMISAYGDETNLRAAEHNGANDFIIKPVDFVMLKQKLLKSDQMPRG